jgi:hypothetical protein
MQPASIATIHRPFLARFPIPLLGSTSLWGVIFHRIGRKIAFKKGWQEDRKRCFLSTNMVNNNIKVKQFKQTAI